MHSSSILTRTAKKRQNIKNISNITHKEINSYLIKSLNLTPNKSNSFSQSLNTKKLFNTRITQEKSLNNSKIKHKRIKSNNSFRNKLLNQSISTNNLMDSTEPKILYNNFRDIPNKSKMTTRNNYLNDIQKTKSYADFQVNNSIDFEKINKHFLVNMSPYVKKLRIRSNNSYLAQLKIPLVDMYDNRLNKHCLYIEKRNKYNIQSTRDFFMRYKQKLDFKKIK